MDIIAFTEWLRQELELADINVVRTVIEHPEGMIVVQPDGKSFVIAVREA